MIRVRGWAKDASRARPRLARDSYYKPSSAGVTLILQTINQNEEIELLLSPEAARRMSRELAEAAENAVARGAPVSDIVRDD